MGFCRWIRIPHRIRPVHVSKWIDYKKTACIVRWAGCTMRSKSVPWNHRTSVYGEAKRLTREYNHDCDCGYECKLVHACWQGATVVVLFELNILIGTSCRGSNVDECVILRWEYSLFVISNLDRGGGRKIFAKIEYRGFGPNGQSVGEHPVEGHESVYTACLRLHLWCFLFWLGLCCQDSRNKADKVRQRGMVCGWDQNDGKILVQQKANKFLGRGEAIESFVWLGRAGSLYCLLWFLLLSLYLYQRCMWYISVYYVGTCWVPIRNSWVYRTMYTCFRLRIFTRLSSIRWFLA